MIPQDGALYLANVWEGFFSKFPAIGGSGFVTTLALFTGPLIPTTQTTLADLTEANFGGYMRQPLSWLPASIFADGSARIRANPVTFTQTARIPTNLVTGWFMVGMDRLFNLHLVALERLQKFVRFEFIGQKLTIAIPLGLLSAFSG